MNPLSSIPERDSRNFSLRSRFGLPAVLILLEILGLGLFLTLHAQAARGDERGVFLKGLQAPNVPAITLTKLTNGPGGVPQDGPFIRTGDVVTWTYIVTNTGTVDLSTITITDDSGTPGNTADDVQVCTIPSLAQGVGGQCLDTGQAQAGQYTNNASVVASVTLTTTITANDSSSYFGASPAILIEKLTNDQDADAAPGPTLVQGSTVNWKYVVTNIGNVALTQVTVTDNPAATITCPKTTLAPNESMTCTASGTVQLGQFSNLATVTGTPPVGPNVNDTDPSNYFGVAQTTTATVTGTPPTPTATGTITPNPGLTVSVSPASARVNQTLTFTIRVTNPGTAPAMNAVVTNSFPSYIDVLSVTINQGSVSKSTHSVTVNIGQLDPGDNVTISISTKVNSSLTTTATVNNVVTLTYDVNQVRTSFVTYSVIATTTLPGTGELPIANRPRPVAGGVLFSVALPFALAGYGVLRGKGNKTIMLLGLLFGLGVILIAACRGDETLKVEFASVEAAPSETSTPTLLPFMPAYRFATPEVYPELPDYPIPSPTIVPTSVSGEAQPDTSPVIRLEIPGLKVDTMVRYIPFEGLTWPVQGLREDVAWLGNTSWPGLGSNTVLAGHVTVEGLGDGPFRYLEKLALGEEIKVYTEEGIYTYTVREHLTVDETDLGVTLPTINPQLTLITCTGWDTELSIYRFRRVVVADLASSAAWVHQGSER